MTNSVILVLVFCGCVSLGAGRKEPENDAFAMPAFTEGYGGATWGTSPAQVDSVLGRRTSRHVTRKIDPESFILLTTEMNTQLFSAADTIPTSWYTDRICDVECSISPRYWHDCFYQIEITFHVGSLSRTSADTVFQCAREALKTKYGKPKDSYELYGPGRYSQWQTDETRVNLDFGVHWDETPYLTLTYTCRDLEKQREAADKEEQERRRKAATEKL